VIHPKVFQYIHTSFSWEMLTKLLYGLSSCSSAMTAPYLELTYFIAFLHKLMKDALNIILLIASDITDMVDWTLKTNYDWT